MSRVYPPPWIGVGTLDLFLDEDMAYAQRLIRAGVEVELNVWPGAGMVYFRPAGKRRAGQRSASELAGALFALITAQRKACADGDGGLNCLPV